MDGALPTSDLTQVAQTNTSTDGAPQDAGIVQLPAAGGQVRQSVSPNQPVEIRGIDQPPTLLTQQGDDLVVDFGASGSVILGDYARLLTQGDAGTLTVGDFLLPPGQLVAALNREELLEPAAGPEAGPQGPQGGGANFNPTEIGNLGDGISASDLLDPTALSFSLPEPDEIFDDEDFVGASEVAASGDDGIDDVADAGTIVIGGEQPSAGPAYSIGGTADSKNPHLYEIDLATGATTNLGQLSDTPFDVEGLALNPTDGKLYGAVTTGGNTGMIVIDLDDVGNPVFLTVDQDVWADVEGMTFTKDGTLFLVTDETTVPEQEALYTANPATGQTTLIGPIDLPENAKIEGLAFDPLTGGLFLVAGSDRSKDAILHELDPSTGAVISALPVLLGDEPLAFLEGFSFDSNGVLWAQGSVTGDIYTIDPQTGQATFVSNSLSGSDIDDDLESLAIGICDCDRAGPGDTFPVSVTVAFSDLDGSEQHFVWVQVPDGLTVAGGDLVTLPSGAFPDAPGGATGTFVRVPVALADLQAVPVGQATVEVEFTVPDDLAADVEIDGLLVLAEARETSNNDVAFSSGEIDVCVKIDAEPRLQVGDNGSNDGLSAASASGYAAVAGQSLQGGGEDDILIGDMGGTRSGDPVNLSYALDTSNSMSFVNVRPGAQPADAEQFVISGLPAGTVVKPLGPGRVAVEADADGKVVILDGDVRLLRFQLPDDLLDIGEPPFDITIQPQRSGPGGFEDIGAAQTYSVDPGQTALVQAKTGLIDLQDSLLGPGGQLSDPTNVTIQLVTFAGALMVNQVFTWNGSAFADAGGTELTDAIAAVGASGSTQYEPPLEAVKAFLADGDRHDGALNQVYFITDGADLDGFQADGFTFGPIDVAVTAVGVGGTVDPAELQAVADEGNGHSDVVLVADRGDLAATLGGQTIALGHELGDDIIDGGAGDDLIFGDALDTDWLLDPVASGGLGFAGGTDGAGLQNVLDYLSTTLGRMPTDGEVITFIRDNQARFIEENRDAADGGNDVLSGGEGDDILLGMGGDDRLDGGAGLDMLYGGTGADAFVFGADSLADATANGSFDTIADYALADGDVVDLSALLDSAVVSAGGGIGNFVSIENGGRDLMVDTDGAGGAAAVKIAEFDGAGVTDVQIYVDDTASYTV
ncbi:MAG: type I secretion C-terminal target domain-containing protein [Inquilinaceae bacterium]